MPPFKSEAQRKYLYANEPEIAEKWSAEEKMEEDDRRKDVEEAYDENTEPEMNYCPSCGKKIPATNTGGASVGGGSAAGGSG